MSLVKIKVIPIKNLKRGIGKVCENELFYVELL